MLVAAGGDSESGLVHAGRRGDIRIIEHLFTLGARNVDTVFGHALGASQLRAMEWALSRGASNWNYALRSAAGNANKPMSILCLYNGANPEIGLQAACEMGHPAHLRLARFFVGRGAVDFNTALGGACEGGTFAGVNYLIDCGATECPYCHFDVEDHRYMFSED